MNSLMFSLKVNALLTQIREGIEQDGGYLELISIEDKLVKVSLTGACKQCPSMQMTLKYGIEKRLQDEIDPSIQVVSVS